MAYAFVGSNGILSHTLTYTATLGNTLIVATATNTTTVGLVVGDTANTYTYLGGAAGSNPGMALFVAPVTTGGALTLVTSGTGGGGATYAMAVWEYSGLAASPYIASSFQYQQQPGPGTGTNAITTASNPNVTSAPAMLFGIACNVGNALQGGTDNGPVLGTAFAYNSRTVPNWIGGASQAAALAEDIRITSTGTAAITFTAGSGSGADTYQCIAAAFIEYGGTGTATIAWIT